MEPERLLRLSVPGSIFALSLFWHYWLLGGDPGFLSNQTGWGAVVAAFVGVPVFGFIISVFGEWLVEKDWKWKDWKWKDWFFGPGLYWGFPADYPVILNNAKLREALSKLLLATQGKISPEALENANNMNDREELYVAANFSYHSRAPVTLIQFTTRRWTRVWTLANSAVAIYLGALLGIIVTVPTRWSYRYQWDASKLWLFVFVDLVVLFYSRRAVRRANDMRVEVCNLAAIWFLEEAAAHNSPTQKPSVEPWVARAARHFANVLRYR